MTDGVCQNKLVKRLGQRCNKQLHDGATSFEEKLAFEQQLSRSKQRAEFSAIILHYAALSSAKRLKRAKGFASDPRKRAIPEKATDKHSSWPPYLSKVSKLPTAFCETEKKHDTLKLERAPA